MLYVSIYANDNSVNIPRIHLCEGLRLFLDWSTMPTRAQYTEPLTLITLDQPLTSICTCTCIMDAQQRREARLSRRREREQRNCALESAEEREARLARRRVRDRALRATQSTAQREALQCRRDMRETSEERTVCRREHERRNRALESREDAVTIHKSQGLTPDPRRSSHQVVGPHMRNICKLAQARPTMPAFL